MFTKREHDGYYMKLYHLAIPSATLAIPSATPPIVYDITSPSSSISSLPVTLPRRCLDRLHYYATNCNSIAKSLVKRPPTEYDAAPLSSVSPSKAPAPHLPTSLLERHESGIIGHRSLFYFGCSPHIQQSNEYGTRKSEIKK